MNKTRAAGWITVGGLTIGGLVALAHPAPEHVTTIIPAWACTTTTYAGQPCVGSGPTTTLQILPTTTTASPPTSASPPTTSCENVNGPIHLPAGRPCPDQNQPVSSGTSPPVSDVQITVPPETTTTMPPAVSVEATTTLPDTPANVKQGPPRTVAPRISLPATR